MLTLTGTGRVAIAAQLIELPAGVGEEVGLANLNGIAETTQSPQIAAFENHNLKGIKVLLAEDSPDNQELVTRVLVEGGAEVDIAENGEQAVSMASEGIYDITLMDIQMPAVDGIAATQRLRQNGYTKPILALTANAMAFDRIRSFEQGFDHHITKPVDLRQLIEEVAEFAPNAHRMETARIWLCRGL